MYIKRSMNVQLAIGYGLIVLSYGLRAYIAVMEKRGPLYTPLAFSGDIAQSLFILFSVSIGFAGLYLGYIGSGITHVVIMLLIYFVILPLIIGPIIRKRAGI